ncbi:MAG: hypothetical protein EZS28_007602 [Streblomastix strix]|uniref:Uncharacterized protein n=1 Tax=Streblomastix strix TaxID=222440 RepID=A0A5J4WPJ1_9EUKA|nr:MAG: hypothetical protein EZS28_007602 [Streblomastix strix]
MVSQQMARQGEKGITNYYSDLSQRQAAVVRVKSFSGAPQIIYEAKGIEKICQLFCNERSNKFNKDRQALCLGILFWSKELPSETKTVAIDYLKSLLSDSDS